MTKEKEILILGIGNEVLGDESLALKLVHDLKSEILIPGVDYLNIFNGGLELLEHIQDYRTIIIIDTIKTRNGIPGTISEFNPGNFKETLHLSSRHDVSFLTSLNIGEKMGFCIPDEIFIIAIEINPGLTFCYDLSEEISYRYKKILTDIKNRIENYVKISGTRSTN